MKLEVFNGVTAYLFLIIIQIFSKQHALDFSEEDKEIEHKHDPEAEDSELFLLPPVKTFFGWVTVGILVVYLVIHLFLFALVLGADCKSKCKARCGKKKPETPATVTSANEVADEPQEEPAEPILSKKLSKRPLKIA